MVVNRAINGHFSLAFEEILLQLSITRWAEESILHPSSVTVDCYIKKDNLAYTFRAQENV